MPFDNVWTQIKFINLSGGSGGAYGPMSGKNHVIWGVDFENVNNDMKERYSSKRIRKSISAFLNPDSFHSGVKVGLKGASRLVEHLKDERYIEIIQNLDQSEHVGDLYEIQKDNF
jgi:hypothetical protein